MRLHQLFEASIPDLDPAMSKTVHALFATFAGKKISAKKLSDRLQTLLGEQWEVNLEVGGIEPNSLNFNAYYDSENDQFGDPPFELEVLAGSTSLAMAAEDWAAAADNFMDFVEHEMVHQVQTKNRGHDNDGTKYAGKNKDQSYYGQPDEIEAYAVNLARQLMRASNGDQAKLNQMLRSFASTATAKNTAGMLHSPNLYGYLETFDFNPNHPVIKSLMKKTYQYIQANQKPSLQEGADWREFKKLAKGAVAGAGMMGAAALGIGDKPAQQPTQSPVQQPAAITQPAAPDSIPASMFNPDDVNPSKTSASTAQNANPKIESMLAKAAAAKGIRGDELAAFLAQTAHESFSFTRMNEMGDAAYFKAKYDIKGKNPELAKRLGNVNLGDGALFHGRGYIHLTGRTNYRIAGEALGLPLEKNPKLAADPEIAARIAVWFWTTRVQPNVSDWDDVRSVTRKINSGMAGLDDRQNNYDFYRKKLSSAPKLAQK